jgi:hypothetical protein
MANVSRKWLMRDLRHNPCANCTGRQFLFAPWNGWNNKPSPNSHVVKMTASFLLEPGGMLSNDELAHVTFTLRVCVGCSAATIFADDVAGLSELTQYPDAEVQFVDADDGPTGYR